MIAEPLLKLCAAWSYGCFSSDLVDSTLSILQTVYMFRCPHWFVTACTHIGKSGLWCCPDYHFQWRFSPAWLLQCSPVW